MRISRTLSAAALTAVALLGVAAPAGASASGAATVDGQLGADAGRGPTTALTQAAGTLHFALDATACRSAGGLFGRGYVGARGYMDEIGATNVTQLKIVITAQAKFTTAPVWRTVQGSAATYTYSFPGAANGASHSLLGPRPNLLWSYNFDANDDAANFLYRMSVKFIWSNPVSTVTNTLNTGQCFSN